ncbi:MAG: hypothetical protein NTW86_31875 [Candidatus Sumerlaeota bacterium]|nr:hypothetical protein [Candidatus Sumerlaeota bacterium]
MRRWTLWTLWTTWTLWSVWSAWIGLGAWAAETPGATPRPAKTPAERRPHTTARGNGRVFSSRNASFAFLHPFRLALWNGDVTTTTVADMDRAARTMAAQYAQALQAGDRTPARQLQGGVYSLALYRMEAARRLGRPLEEAAAELRQTWEAMPEIKTAPPMYNPAARANLLRSAEKRVDDDKWLSTETASFSGAQPDGMRLAYLKGLSPAGALVARAYESGLDSVSVEEVAELLGKTGLVGADHADLAALLAAKTGSASAAEAQAAATGETPKKAFTAALARQGAAVRAQQILKRLDKPEAAASMAEACEKAKKKIADSRLPIAD